jgi:mannitol-1-/sugar-/sorbitol-6-/2-deoxyglucose-6-phosphatase
MIRAVIFDMDGVLIDSEPFWQDAEMEVFATVGIELTRAQCIDMAGMPTNDIVELLYKRHSWTKKTQDQVTEEIIGRVQENVVRRGVPMEGVFETLDFFNSRCIPMAVASSSPQKLIDTTLSALRLTEKFPITHSAEVELYAKPHPAVFLSAAKKLDVNPMHCLVIEDSLNGLISAKAARMKTVVVPMPVQQHDPRFAIADVKLRSLTEFSDHIWNKLNQ